MSTGQSASIVLVFTGGAPFNLGQDVDLTVDSAGDLLAIDPAGDVLIVTPGQTWTGQSASEIL